VYFCTQNPRDIPDGVLAQLGNKVQHGLRAYTPSDQKSVKAAAESYRENPAFDTYDTILNLGTGEAVVSFLGADGIPTMAEKVYILPPQSNFGTISDSQRDTLIKSSICYSKYAEAVDPDSAFEFLERRGVEEAEALAKEKAEAEAAKQKEKEEKEAAKQAEKEEKEAARAAEKAEKEAARKAEAEAKAAQREKEKEEAAKKRAAKTVASSITGTVGREVGKTVGGKFGKFGKTLGGNVGASLGRGLLSTLFSKK
jgi:biotin carboxyl carrier protein